MTAKAHLANIAAEHLRASKNPGIIWGDEMLAHEIAEKAGLVHEGPATTRKILDALEGFPLFKKSLISINWCRRGGAKLARRFDLVSG